MGTCPCGQTKSNLYTPYCPACHNEMPAFANVIPFRARDNETVTALCAAYVADLMYGEQQKVGPATRKFKALIAEQRAKENQCKIRVMHPDNVPKFIPPETDDIPGFA